METQVKSSEKKPHAGRLRPRQDLIDAGYFRVVKGQTRVTLAGVKWIASRYAPDLPEAEIERRFAESVR